MCADLTVAYVYERDASNPAVQSGRPFAILRELRARGCQVVEIFPLDVRAQRRFLWKKILYRAAGRIYRTDREAAVLQNVAAQIRRRLEGVRADCVFSPGSHAIARLDVGVPKIFCADATFRNMLDFYEDFTGCAAEYVRQGEEQERLALRSAAAAIYPSDWAANVAMRHYGASPKKVHVAPFGANVEALPMPDLLAALARRSRDEMRVLFIGREWRRKDLPKVLATCDCIAAAGVTVRLDVVGGQDYRGPRPAFAHFHGFLRGSNENESRLLRGLLADAHFLFVPSRAENFGMAFCEGAAYAVPVVTTNVGGIPTIVRHGVTGICVPPDTTAEEFARMMVEIFRGQPRYEAMARAARAEYDARLNWRVFGDRLMEVLHQACTAGAP